ncbi:hypothetical protein NKH77_19160 [Streptomyces sp. M19]
MPMQPLDFEALFAPGPRRVRPDGRSATVAWDRVWLSLPTGHVVAVEPGYSRTRPPSSRPCRRAATRWIWSSPRSGPPRCLPRRVPTGRWSRPG